MRRLVLPAVVAMVLSGGFALAQAAPQATDPVAGTSAPAKVHRHAPNPHREALRMSQRLNLSTDQTAKLEPILAGRDQKIAALRNNPSITAQDMKVQMRAIHKDMKQQLSTVLTPEQIQQMKAMHHGRGAAGQAPAPVAPATT